MFCVIYVTVNIENVLMWLEYRLGDNAPLVDGSINITLCFTPTRTSIRCCLKSFTSCSFLVDSMPQILKLTGLKSGLFGSQKSRRSYNIAVSDWRQRIMHRMSG